MSLLTSIWCITYPAIESVPYHTSATKIGSCLLSEWLETIGLQEDLHINPKIFSRFLDLVEKHVVRDTWLEQTECTFLIQLEDFIHALSQINNNRASQSSSCSTVSYVTRVSL